MIDPTIQTETDREVRAQYIALGLITPLEAQDQWTQIRRNMASIKANIAKRKPEWADAEAPVNSKERRYGRA